jgi:glutamine cyclotransferase
MVNYINWQEKTGFIYNATFKTRKKSFAYTKDIEGWGMTNDVKTSINLMEQRKLGLPIQKPTNVRLQCVPGKTKIKALMT